jgi:nitroimidazol reductase NimA-like FMN-containing flavoprotein (pyridoxamine 5'-phosphate oxidase superfamily)
MTEPNPQATLPPEWSLADPRPSRPQLPPTYQVIQTLEGIIPWSAVAARLGSAHMYWVATTRPDARPHVTPVWGVWLGNMLYFDGHPDTRRGRNLALNSAVAVHLESNDAGKDVVIVEGRASHLDSPPHQLTELIARLYTSKYVEERYAPTPSDWDGGGLYAVRPHTVFAWGGHLGNTATRWQFEGSSRAM